MITIFKTHQLHTRTPLRIFTLVSLFSFTLAHTFTPSIAPVPGQPFETGELPYGIAYSPNGKWLSNVSGDGFFHPSLLSSFSVGSDGSLSSIAAPLSINFYQPISVEYSPDSRFASVSGQGNIDIFSINQITGQPSFSSLWDTGGQSIIQTTYSPSGEFLAAASFAGITMFRVDIATGTLTFLNTLTPSENFNFTGNTAQVISFSPDGNFLAGAGFTSFGNGVVTIFSVDQSGNLSNQQNFPITTSTFLIALAYSPNGKFLATVDHENTITICSVDTSTGSLTVIEQVSTDDGESNQTVAFSPDSQFVVQTNPNGNNMYVYSVNATGHLTQFGDPLATGSYPATNTVFSPINHDGVALCSTANFISNDITSYAFSLCSPTITAPTITSPANGSSFAVGTSIMLSGTLSSGNSLMLSSSNTAIAAIGPVSITATNWTAPLTMLAHGSVTITATATNCAGNAATTDATYTVTASGVNQNGFSINLFNALHAKYFLE